MSCLNLLPDLWYIQAYVGVFMKICSSCLLEKEDSNFGSGRAACKSCYSTYNRSYYERNKEKIAVNHLAWRESHPENLRCNRERYRSSDLGKAAHKRYAQTLKGNFSRYTRGARRRGLEFNLTFEQFETFWQQPCSYCGDLIETIGLDRIDSFKGYELGNCTSCCSMCNLMKLDHSLEDWISKMESILRHLGR